MAKRLTSFVGILTLAVFILFCASASWAAEKQSGTVTIESKSIAIGIGVSWGDGTLKFQGKEYAFSLKGLSVIDLGISSLSVAGEVYNLDKLEDFNGTYMAGSAGAAVAGGVQKTNMKNQQGVVIKLHSTQQGVKFTLAPEGVKLQLK